jgi:hypothetical protein
MLPVSLDCPFSVFSNVYSSSWRIHVKEYWTWTIQKNWQHKAYRTKNKRMLPVSLDCPCSVFFDVYSSSCVPYVASFSGSSIFGILWRVFFVMCALCCQFLWIVHFRYSLTCILRQNTEHGQSRKTGNIRHTWRRIHVREYRTWTIQRNWQHKAHRTKNTR